MLEQTDRLLDEISINADEEETASEYAKKLLSVMEYGVPYTASAIMQKLNLKSKETFRQHYMNPAIALGILEKAVPDKPTSRIRGTLGSRPDTIRISRNYIAPS